MGAGQGMCLSLWNINLYISSGGESEEFFINYGGTINSKKKKEKKS